MGFRAAVPAIIAATILGALSIAALAQSPPPRANVQLKATLEGHTGRIIEFAFSPDGGTVATASEDGSVRLWNTQTGELRATLNCARKNRWVSIRWSPDGRAIAVNGTGNDQTLQIWDTVTGKMKADLGPIDATAVSWSPDNRMLVTTRFGKGVAKLWDTETGTQLATFEQDPPCPKGSFLKALLNDEPCRDFSLVTAYFDATGQSVITASSQNDAKLWDARTSKRKTVMPLRGEEFAERLYQSELVLSPDRRLVVRYIHNEVSLLDTSTGEVKRALGQIGLPIAFSPDSKMLLTTVRKPADSSPGKWDEFTLYDIATGELRLRFERSYLTVFRSHLQWSRDGHTILLGAGSAQLLDARTGRVKGSIKYDACVADRLFGDDGCQPYILSADGRVAIKVTNPIRLWDADNNSLLTTLETAHAPALFSPTNPRLLITRSKEKKTALLWEVGVN